MEDRLKKIVKQVPNDPGCYKFYDKKGELIYIGKAKNLKKRVGSYFSKNHPDVKTPVLVENIRDIKWETTESEIEALVLESLLIKKYKPRFNIKIKDDKDFLWVKIDMNNKFPVPELVRRPNVGTGLKPIPTRMRFFGPFTDPKLLKQGMNTLRRIFLWRDCSENKFSFYKKRGGPCLEYYIKNCPAPCADFVNANHYQLGIKQLVMFLEGKKMGLAKGLKKEMGNLAKEKKFEEAGIVRDKLRALEHIDASLKSQNSKVKTQNSGVASRRYIENIINILNKELGYQLKYKKDFRIEFYDISNTSGQEAVGSMIVWQEGNFASGEYRKFKIRSVKGPNDVLMLKEVLVRRLRKIFNFQFSIFNQISISNDQKDKSFSKKPDLIILDGGKPQLGEIWKLLQKLKVEVPLLSLAKKEEEVWGITQNSKIKSQKYGVASPRFVRLSIIKDSPEGFFVQRLRDEAHRFAIGYHKVLRKKEVIKSRLDEIEGIGPVLKKKLLLKFGSVDGIMRASVSEVEKVVGDKMAKRLKELL